MHFHIMRVMAWITCRTCFLLSTDCRDTLWKPGISIKSLQLDGGNLNLNAPKICICVMMPSIQLTLHPNQTLFKMGTGQVFFTLTQSKIDALSDFTMIVYICLGVSLYHKWDSKWWRQMLFQLLWYGLALIKTVALD